MLEILFGQNVRSCLIQIISESPSDLRFRAILRFGQFA